MKAQDLSDYLSFAIENKFPVLIMGKPGIGKSDIVEQACTDAKAKLILSHPVVSDPTDYKGLPFINKDGEAHFMPFNDLNELINAKESTVFFLDDLGQAPASVQAACMQLLLARRINGHKVSDHVTFMAATNRKQDRAGVSGLLEPVKSRFGGGLIELEVTTDDWVKWGLTHNMPVELLSFIRFRPSLLDKFEPTKDLTNGSSPRTVAAVGKIQNAGLKKSIEFEVFQGVAGIAFASEYCGFLKMYRELPDIDQIILNPKGSPVSKEPGVLYALAGALASRMNGQNIESILTYLERIPTEISVVTVKDAITRDRNLCATKGFIKWSTENGNVIL